MLTIAGDQVPVTPLSEVVGNTGAVTPAQMSAIGSNSGVMLGLTITVMVTIVAH